MSTKQRQLSSLLKIIWGFLVFFLLSMLGALIFTWLLQSKNQAHTQFPIYGTIPDFTLTERNGSSFGLTDLNGKIWVADFIFTSCAGTCPIMTVQMAKLQAALPKELDIKLVSITVDPMRDTPEILSKYADTFGAEIGRWFFLTGPYNKIVQLANEGFHLSAGQIPPEDSPHTEMGPITHSIKFALIDRQGRIRGYYDGTDQASVKALIRDIKVLNHKDTT